MRTLSDTVVNMPRSGIRTIMELAFEQPNVIHLESGEPDFPTPKHIVDAGIRAIQEGYTKYTPGAGLLSLREKIVDKLWKENGVDSTVENITVTPGGVAALASAVLAIANHKDEVLVPDPGWPNFYSAISLAGAVPVPYSLDPENGFIPSLDKLREKVTEHTKLMIINSPSNPTGTVYSPDMIRALVEFAVETDIYLLSDEVYEHFVFEGKQLSPSSICDDGRVVSIFSFSKTYAMTGWRIGFAVSDKQVAGLMRVLQEPLTSCVAGMSQKAAEAALSAPQTCVREMRQSYRDRRDMAVKILESKGSLDYIPAGAFYSMIDISKSGMTSQLFAEELLNEMGVAVAPGSAFGKVAENYVRISLATKKTKLHEGLEKILSFIESKA